MKYLLCFLMMFSFSLAQASGKNIKNCSNIQRIEQKSQQGKLILQLVISVVNRYQKEKVTIAKVNVFNRINDWCYLDVEFDRLDAAIFIVKRQGKLFEISDQLGGDLLEEGAPEDKINDYFKRNGSKVPEELIRCSAQESSKFW